MLKRHMILLVIASFVAGEAPARSQQPSPGPAPRSTESRPPNQEARAPHIKPLMSNAAGGQASPRILKARRSETDAKCTGTDQVQAAVVIRNTGQTPAHDVTVSSTAQTWDITQTATFGPTPVGPDFSRFVFGPPGFGRRNIRLHTLIGDPRAVVALKAGTGVLYVYGEILYRDAFGYNHHTSFRHMIGGSVGWPDDNKMPVCPEGNEAK